MVNEQTYVTGFSRFDSGSGGSAPAWLRTLRRNGIAEFEKQGFPTQRNEAWRFTRIRPLLAHEFTMPENGGPNGTNHQDLGALTFADGACRRLVFVNGHHARELSAPGRLENGLRIGSLQEALREGGDVLRGHLARLADTTTHPFAALNTAYLRDGAFVHVPKGVAVAEPIHIVYVSTTGAVETMSHPRNLIVVEDGGRATVIESYAGHEGVYFTNAVTEIVTGNDSDVDHYKVQRESEQAYHTALLTVKMAARSRFNTDCISLGGTLVRNDVVTILDGEGIEATLDGLYLGDGHQHIDNHTLIEHAKPHCESHELYKGILAGRAKAVFNGKIHVHRDAQKTDAKQSNGCMLLSEDAQINTNPQLEIYADDVKCTHGAVVGQVDEDAVFYLRSRGIEELQARHMLVHAFAGEVLERIKVEPLRERLESDLYTWLSRAGRTTA